MVQTLNTQYMEIVMAIALPARTGKEMLPSDPCSPTYRHGTTCARCGGLMVGEFCMDLLNSTGELEAETLRCVQCGEVVDPVILQNRRRQQEAMTGKASRLSVQSLGSEIAA
jgi:hypothetical protein